MRLHVEHRGQVVFQAHIGPVPVHGRIAKQRIQRRYEIVEQVLLMKIQGAVQLFRGIPVQSGIAIQSILRIARKQVLGTGIAQAPVEGERTKHRRVHAHQVNLRVVTRQNVMRVVPLRSVRH